MSDPSFDKFRITTHDVLGLFVTFLSLFDGREIQANVQFQIYLNCLSDELGCSEIMRWLSGNDNDPSFGQKIVRAEKKISSNLDADELIGDIAANINLISVSEVQCMSIPLLESVFAHPLLGIKSGHALLSLIVQLISKNRQKYIDLLVFVDSSSLNEDDIAIFIDQIEHMEFSGRLWSNLKKRLLYPVSNARRRGNEKKSDILFKGDKFDGVFSYLNYRAGGNAVEKGLIKMTVSGAWSNNPYIYLVEACGDSFSSTNNPDEFIHFDLLDFRLKLTGYTLKSDWRPQNSWQPKNWAVLGSNDNAQWQALDERQDNSDLNGPYMSQYFPCSPDESSSYRYIKIARTGPNWSGDNYLVLKQIELFGFLS